MFSLSNNVVPLIKIPNLAELHELFKNLKLKNNSDPKVMSDFKHLYKIYEVASETGPYKIADECFDLLSDLRLARNVLAVEGAFKDTVVQAWIKKFEIEPQLINVTRVATKQSLLQASKERNVKAKKAFNDLMDKAKAVSQDLKKQNLKKLSKAVMTFSELLDSERTYLSKREIEKYETLIKLLNIEISLNSENLDVQERSDLLKQKSLVLVRFSKLDGINPFTLI
jgi:hypothetical protein